MLQSSFRSGATSPCREFSYAEFPYRGIPYAPVQFQKWRHFPLQGIFLCRIPYGPVQFQKWRQSSFVKWRHSLIGNFPTENFCIGNFPIIGTFLFLAPLLQKISLQKICCVIQFHTACSILPVAPLVGRRGQRPWWQRQSGTSGSGKFPVPRCPKPQRQSS